MGKSCFASNVISDIGVDKRRTLNLRAQVPHAAILLGNILFDLGSLNELILKRQQHQTTWGKVTANTQSTTLYRTNNQKLRIIFGTPSLCGQKLNNNNNKSSVILFI